MVRDAAEYRWSTAAAHCGRAAAEAWLDTDTFDAAWNARLWREFLKSTESEEELAAIRTSAHTGRPLGGPEFVAGLERALGRKLTAAKGGRTARVGADERQELLGFGGE